MKKTAFLPVFILTALAAVFCTAEPAFAYPQSGATSVSSGGAADTSVPDAGQNSQNAQTETGIKPADENDADSNPFSEARLFLKFSGIYSSLGDDFDGQKIGASGAPNQTYFFIPKVDATTGFDISIGEKYKKINMGWEAGLIYCQYDGKILLENADMYRSYTNGDASITFVNTYFRYFLYMPLDKSFDVSPFIGFNFTTAANMNNVNIDNYAGKYQGPDGQVMIQVMQGGFDAGLSADYNLTDNIDFFLGGQFMFGCFSYNKTYPVVLYRDSAGNSLSGDLLINNIGVSAGIKIYLMDLVYHKNGCLF